MYVTHLAVQNPGMEPLLPGSWRWRGLSLCLIAAAVLLTSWLWPASRAYWDQIDHAAFAALNGGLALGGLWQVFWAAMSVRAADLLGGLVMLACVITPGFVFPPSRLREALHALLAVIACAIVVRFAFEWLFVIPFHEARASPSLLEPHAIRLSEIYAHWRPAVKDASHGSFPGDHAALLLAWAFFMSAHARDLRLLETWIVAVFFMLPRLVAGAHWLTDAVVGGGVIALLSIAIAQFTPAGARIADWLDAHTAGLRKWLQRVPLLGRLSILR